MREIQIYIPRSVSNVDDEVENRFMLCWHCSYTTFSSRRRGNETITHKTIREEEKEEEAEEERRCCWLYVLITKRGS